MTQPRYLEVEAEVRYWEDAHVGGVEDSAGTLIPFRTGALWTPVIDLDSGTVVGWPEGVEANVHYKVCDAGEYWLQDASRTRVLKWLGHYVPNSFLCVGDSGYGDYIIFKVAKDGTIPGWTRPDIDPEQWEKIP